LNGPAEEEADDAVLKFRLGLDSLVTLPLEPEDAMLEAGEVIIV
jgi:hypothetical protein